MTSSFVLTILVLSPKPLPSRLTCNFLLSAGARLAFSFEGEVTSSGSFASSMPFSKALTSLPYQPYGHLSAHLPFQATQTSAIKFEDDDSFDTKDILVKVDFAIFICPVVSAVDGLLGKLSSLELSPKNLLVQVETAGLNLTASLDDYFPSLAEFILEGTP